MNIEMIKSIVLSILVGFSLLLTFSLWNSQPNLDYIANHPEYVNEVNIGGREEMKESIIKPNLIIFHKSDEYYGLPDPIQELNLYKRIQDWELENYQISDADGRPTNQEQIEVIFPTLLPIEMIHSLFTLHETDHLPDWLFKNIFISFNQANSWLEVTFLSADGTQKVEYTVKDVTAYNYLQSFTTFDNRLMEYLLFSDSGERIYLPTEPVRVKHRSITIQTIDAYLLVNALFTNPSNVRPNIGEASFSDGQRGLQMLNEGRSMEFINPIHANGEFMDPLLLLERSLEKVNEHKGWTNDFNLIDIDVINNAICFRMHYDGYPVFSAAQDPDLALIEQRFLNQELHLYRRPLFKLDNLLGGEEEELPSSEEIIESLTISDYYDYTKVTEIQIGYKLIYLEGTSYSLSLEPAWFMNYGGEWIEIIVDQHDYY